MDIKKFSALVGVSTATVSRAYSGNGRISEATKNRIFQLAEAHGYTPNIHAQRLNSRKSSIIGVYYSFSSAPIFGYYHMELAQELSKAAHSYGYTTHLELTQEMGEPSMALQRTISGNGLDGIIMVGDTREGAVEALKKFKPCPCVVIANRAWELNEAGGLVCINQNSGISEAIAHLKKAGHKKIGFIRGLSGGAKMEAFEKAMAQQDLTCDPRLIRVGPMSYEDGQRAISELIPLKVTAVLCSTDILALGAISGATKAGVGVPADLSIIGIDNLAFTPFVNPTLASVGIPRREMAESALSILHQLIEESGTRESKGHRQYIHTINTRFIPRESLSHAPKTKK